MARNLESLPASVTQLDENRSLGDLPIRILTAGKNSGGRRNPEHDRDADLSSRGQCTVVPEAGHWVQLDAPELVIAAIREVCEE